MKACVETRIEHAHSEIESADSKPTCDKREWMQSASTTRGILLAAKMDISASQKESTKRIKRERRRQRPLIGRRSRTRARKALGVSSRHDRASRRRSGIAKRFRRVLKCNGGATGFSMHPRGPNRPVFAHSADENRGENWQRCTRRTRYAS